MEKAIQATSVDPKKKKKLKKKKMDISFLNI